MIPIRDDNPTFSTPYVTIGLIVINTLVFLLEVSGGAAGQNEMVYKYGYVPAELVRSSSELRREVAENPQAELVRTPFGIERRFVPIPLNAITAVPASINIVTAMFLHGGWMHLVGNMLFLWIFGNNIEDRLGHITFVFYYLATGVIGNLAHTFFEPTIQPLVGASGAISGVMGGYILLFPHARILAMVPVGWYPIRVLLPAWAYLGIYILLQNIFPALGGQRGGVAYLAHIGGFLAGMAFIYLFPHRKRPAYARPIDEEDADVVI